MSLIVSPLAPLQAATVSQVSYTFDEGAEDEYSFTGSEIEFDPSGAAKLYGVQANWYNRSWQYRQKLVIDKSKVRGEHTDFPVLVSISDQTNQLFGQAQSDGDDILFTSSDGTTKLSHEIEEYTDDGSKKLVAWVKVPTVTDTTDTTLYLYYGNGSASSQQDVENVWASTFAMVQHLNEDPSGSSPQATDSTSNNNDGTASGLTTSDSVAGKIGKSVDFNGTNHISVPDSASLKPAKITMSAWAKNTTGAVLNKSNHNDYTIWYDGGYYLYSDSGISPTSPNFGTDNTWHYVVGVRDGSNLILYVDGSRVGSVAISGDIVHSGARLGLTIGEYDPSSTNCCGTAGQIDELRVASVPHSASYIATEYNNQSSPETFFKSSTIDPTANKSERLSTISPKEDNAVAYTTLSFFTESATKNGGQIRYQLSNDAGKTWYWWNGSPSAWVQETGLGFQEANAADTVNEHISKLPVRDNLGYGKLLWRAYLKSDGSQLVQLDSVTIGYTPHGSVGTTSKKSTGTSLSSPLVKAINSIFKMANDRDPTYDEWKYWTQRIARKDKKTLPELYGAMQWQKLFGQ